MSDVAADLEVRRRFPSHCRGTAVRRIRPTAQHGVDRRQHHAAHSLRLFPRRGLSGRCNKRRPGSGCAALHGLNRNHAIFGWSESCVATHPSDLAVALAAMDAIVIVRGQTGERRIPFTDFHRLPGSTPERDNVLDRGDLIVAIEVPASVEAHASHYLKVRDRASYEFALVSAAAAVATDGRRIRSARLAMGGVAHKPWRLTAAESGAARNFVGRHRRAQVGDCYVIHRCPPTRSQRLQSRAGAARCPARVANRGSTHMNAVGQPISRIDGRLKVTGGARYTADIRARGHRPRRDRLQHDREWPHRVDRHRCRRKGTRRARRAHPQKHAAHEPAALEPSAPAGTNLPAASGRPDSLRGSAGRVGRRRHARPGDLCRHADQGRRTRRIRPRCSTCERLSEDAVVASAAHVAALVIGRGCRQGDRGRRSQNRADLYDARPPSQPDGAARDLGGLGRRRHANAIRLDSDGRRHEEARFARARYSGRENQCRVRVPGRRVRRQVLVLAAHVAGRARREGGEPAGPPAAYPRADVLDGGPPGGDRSDDRSWRRP